MADSPGCASFYFSFPPISVTDSTVLAYTVQIPAQHLCRPIYSIRVLSVPLCGTAFLLKPAKIEHFLTILDHVTDSGLLDKFDLGVVAQFEDMMSVTWYDGRHNRGELWHQSGTTDLDDDG